MSAATPATRAIRQANNGIGTWLMDLVSGAGSSPSHIIVTGILGVVPGVGQAMDARDLVIGIIVVVKSPASVSAWVNLAINLIGCIPALGDALKVGFKLMMQGKSFGRVLEAVSPKLRGNVERYMRNINWATLAAQSKSLFLRSVDAFIDGIDSWVVKVVAGRREVAQVIAELQAVRRRGPQMIDQAFAELRSMHRRMMGDQLPRNTAAVTPPVRRTAAPQRAPTLQQQRAAAQRVQRRLAAKRAADEKLPRTSPNSTSTSTKKKAEPKKQKWSTGIPAEHITDYCVRRKHRNYKKINNNGRLTEETSPPHNGMDHLWQNVTATEKKFVVGETKSSIFDSFTLIAALPADLAAQFNALRADEAANPVPSSGKPNIFDSTGRDELANRNVGVGTSPEAEEIVRKGVNKPGIDKHGTPTGLATQMSHDWIQSRLEKEELIEDGEALREAITLYRFSQVANPNAPAPYHRWICLVTGRQLRIHQQSKGATHNIQITLTLPDNILHS